MGGKNVAKDPKTGTGKKPKGSGRKILKILYQLSMLPLQMLKLRLEKSKISTNRMLEKYKSSLLWSNEPKYLGKPSKPRSQKERKKLSGESTKKKNK